MLKRSADKGFRTSETKSRVIPFFIFALLLFITITFFLSFASDSHAITITGSEEITTNSSASYSAAGCNGTVTWNVAGTGASINSNGVLTTGPASCGAITVTAHCSDGSIATKEVRVSNAGGWVAIASCNSQGANCGGATCTLITGKYKYVTYYHPGSTPSYPCPPSDPCVTEPQCPSYGCVLAPPLLGCSVMGSSKSEWQCPACTNGQTISCYTGTGGTQGVGICKAGTQTCVNGQWGACVGEVLPQAEICGNNIDENCDGQVDEGCATCEVSVNVSPSVVWPLIPQSQRPVGYKEDWTKADVVVTLNKPAPPEGCTVNLKVEPVDNSGGHIHNGGRNNYKGTLDKETIYFAEMGAQSAKYKSSEVGGEEKIKAEVKGEAKSEVRISVRVPGFFELGAGDGYVLIGQTNTHPGNHYGTDNTLYSLLDLAGVYYEENKGTLRINDISLPWGGAFDLCGQWDPGKTCSKYPKGGHKTHRVGKTVDVSNMTAEGKAVTKKSLIKIIDDLDINVTVLDEGNHFHLTFP